MRPTREDERVVELHRFSVTTDRPFDDVVAAVYAGLGRVPDFRESVRSWSTAGDRAEFDAIDQTPSARPCSIKVRLKKARQQAG